MWGSRARTRFLLGAGRSFVVASALADECVHHADQDGHSAVGGFLRFGELLYSLFGERLRFGQQDLGGEQLFVLFGELDVVVDQEFSAFSMRSRRAVPLASGIWFCLSPGCALS